MANFQFSYTGSPQSWAVPADVGQIRIELCGAQGGRGGGAGSKAGGFAGPGARVEATLDVSPGEQFHINVGGRGGDGSAAESASLPGVGGYNGGGRGGNGSGLGGAGGGGGGASEVHRNGTALADRILVAAGGGGGGGTGVIATLDASGTMIGAEPGNEGGEGGEAASAGSEGRTNVSPSDGGDGGSAGGASAGGTGGVGARGSTAGLTSDPDGASGTSGGSLTGGDGGDGNNALGHRAAGGGGGGGGTMAGGGGGGGGTFITPANATFAEGSAGGGGGGGTSLGVPTTPACYGNGKAEILVTKTIPGTPTFVYAQPGDRSARVEFGDAPRNGGTIGHYTVTAFPGGATATGASSPITVNGLTNGNRYRFTVSATNEVGTGAPTAPSNEIVVGRFQPDAMVRVKGQPAYTGNDIYAPTQQTIRTTLAKGYSKSIELVFQNDGNVADSFLIEGTPAIPGIVDYFAPGRITDAVGRGTYRTPMLAPGKEWKVALGIYGYSRAKPGDIMITRVSAMSTRHPERGDGVEIQTKFTGAPAPRHRCTITLSDATPAPNSTFHVYVRADMPNWETFVSVIRDSGRGTWEFRPRTNANGYLVFNITTGNGSPPTGKIGMWVSAEGPRPWDCQTTYRVT